MGKEMDDFMYQFFHFMKWSEELKDAYERLNESDKKLVNEYARMSENPAILNKEITKWYESLHATTSNNN